MFYQELFHTDIERVDLKEYFRRVYQKKKKLDSVLKECDEVYLSPIETKIGQLSESAPLFEKDFLLFKQQLFELKRWLKVFYEAASEAIPSFSHISPLELHRQQAQEKVERLLAALTPFEPAVRERRKDRLTQNVDKQIAAALRTIEKPFEKTLQSETDPQKKEELEQFLQQQRFHFSKIAHFFLSHFDEWENFAIREAKGLLFVADPKQFPFPVIYTFWGKIYIILEVKGHFLGIGAQKIVCRALNLHTAEILAAVKLHAALEDKEKDQELVKKSNFQDAWRESEILAKLSGKQGVLQLCDRLCFEVKGEKVLYLLEHSFPDGSLQDYFKRVWVKNNPADIFPLATQIHIALQLLIGLESIHELHYVHADIKPANILLNLSRAIPIVAITDFNSAYLSDDADETASLHHTPGYAPPELAQIMHNKSAKTLEKSKLLFKIDIWGMGCVFYSLFFNEPLPWWKQGKQEAYAHVAALKAGWVNVQREHPCFLLIERMLEVEMANRPSATEALHMLALIAQKVGVV